MAEYLDIYDEQMRHIGTAAREDVHLYGYWHQTFHCWVVLTTCQTPYVVVQKRHPAKDTNPNMLDVSCAGHLLAGETVAEGVRELAEELGIQVSFEELISLGTTKEEYHDRDRAIQDNEFCQVFALQSNLGLEEMTPQQSEVLGLYLAKVKDVLELFRGHRADIPMFGFCLDEAGNRVSSSVVSTKEDFVGRNGTYYVDVMERILAL